MAISIYGWLGVKFWPSPWTLIVALQHSRTTVRVCDHDACFYCHHLFATKSA